MLKYLNGTRNLGLTISLKNLGIVRWYVYASFGTHGDCKGHTVLKEATDMAGGGQTKEYPTSNYCIKLCQNL